MTHYMQYILLLSITLNIASCKQEAETENLSGKELSKKYCQSCHLYTEPGMLDQYTWNEFILIRMGTFMGIYQDHSQYYDQIPEQWIEPGKGGERVKAAGVYPKNPQLSKEEWEAIKTYYLSSAPKKLSANPKKADIQIGITGFEEKVFHNTKNIVPTLQGIYFDESKNELLAADFTSNIYKLNNIGNLTGVIQQEGLFIDVEVKDGISYALSMGTRYASDNPQGKLIKIQGNQSTNLLSELMRPVNFDMMDINLDGQEDFLICEYGNLLGAINLYLSDGDGFTKNTLFHDDGAVKAQFTDQDGDGDMDIIALVANSDERLLLYTNDGNNQFSQSTIQRFKPTNGSTHFQLVDFDQDGDLDILYSAGDNGDYTPILKPYHGMTLFENKESTYQRKFFLPLNGVYQAEAHDFDQDGDMDIAAVSFHPDFQNNPEESFVVFNNNGNNGFSAQTIKHHNASRWMRFTTGDPDDDGDLDIFLSAMNIKTPEIPKYIADNWQKEHKAIMYLENTLK